MPSSARPEQERPVLTREAVVDTALAIADREGLKALSLRRLALSFGVTPMALYHYVDGKDALLSAIADRAFSQFELPSEDVSDWREILRTLARSYRRLLIGHPSIAAIAAEGLDASSEAGLRVTDVLLAALQLAGFSTQEAAVLQANLERFVLGLVMLEIGGRSDNPAALEERSRVARARLLTLPPAEFPHVVQAAEFLCAPPDADWAFEMALDLLIGGLESLAARDR
jgi:AcrR family transcriptional regulator